MVFWESFRQSHKHSLQALNPKLLGRFLYWGLRMFRVPGLGHYGFSPTFWVRLGLGL